MTHQYMEIKIKELEKRIEALEQEPCNDAISRQAVLNYIGRIYNQGTGKQKSFEFIQKFVEKLQPVKPQPKTGHWIEHSEIKTTIPKYLMFYECSECGDKHCFDKSVIHKKHFCNNCGARMESEVRNETSN